MIDLNFRRTAARDLSRHLDKRIETVLHDFMDRCAVIGADETDATTLALTLLMHYAVSAVRGLGATESDFMVLCQWNFKELSGCGEE
jgi:hypothetical protein